MKNGENFQDSASILGKLKTLFFGRFYKWLYIAVGIPACYIAYNVIMSFDKKGIFTSISDTVERNISDIKILSETCPQLILDFPKFIECLGF